MVKTVIGVIGVTALLAACSHQRPTANGKCTTCPPQKQCASQENVDELALIKRRTSTEFDELEEKYKKATAWRTRWNDTFSRLQKDIDGSLASVDEGEDEEADGNMENVIRYSVDVLNGSLHVTFKNGQVFKNGKAELSEMGVDIVERMATVIQHTTERKITIGSRTTVRNENLNHAQWLKVRELSAKRALTVMGMFEKSGLDPSYLIAASLSNRLEEDPLEQGTTILIFHPIPGETPRYPEWSK